MSYRKYELPKQPRTPLDGPMTAVGVVAIALTFALIALLAWVVA
jgi:hypothetical protein